MKLPDSKTLEMFRCPVTQAAVRLMSDTQLETLNSKIRAGSVVDRDGNAITSPLESGLINADDSFAYSIRGSIIQLTSGQAIALN